MRKFLLALTALLAAVPSYAQRIGGTKAYQEFVQALTGSGNFGVPRYTTALLPTCNTAAKGALAFNTTTATLQVCDGSAWGNVSSGLSSPIAGDFVATGKWTFGTAADAASSLRLGETAGCIVREGATADAFESTTCTTDPTVDVTFNYPNPGASGAGTYSILTTAAHPLYHSLEEEFVSGTNTGNQIGLYGWALGAGTVTGVTAVASHPGVWTLSSTNSSGTIGRLHLGLAGVAPYVPADIQHMVFLVNPRSGTTTMSARFGCLSTVTGSTETSQGMYWSFDPATSANWRSVSRDGGGVESNSTSTAYATSTWFQLEIRKASGGTNWEFWLNGTLAFTHSTRLPTAACFPGFFIETGEAVAKTIDVDYFFLVGLNPMSARF